METDNHVEQAQEQSPDASTTEFAHSWTPVLADFSLRCISLLAFRMGYVSSLLFWSLQILLIPTVLVVVLSWRESRVKAQYPGAKCVVRESAQSTTVFLLIAAVGAAIALTAIPPMNVVVKVILYVVLALTYLIYMIALSVWIVRGKSIEDTIREREEIDRAVYEAAEHRADDNDIRLARMHTELRAIERRVDSFVLESTVFGALAFSGFVTIISSERPFIDQMRLVATALESDLALLPQGHISQLLYEATGMRESIWGLVAIETLFCSLFYATVIASRIRFYDAQRRVEYAVQVATIFNDKENALDVQVAASPVGQTELALRLATLSDRVEACIEHAEPLLVNLRDLARFMLFFRSLGIGTFFVVIVTAGMAVSPRFGLLIAVLVSLGLGYAMLERLTRERRMKRVPFFRGLDRWVFSRRIR